MKKFILDFLHRGMVAAGFGPVVLAVVYLILQQAADVQTLSVEQVCTGIFSITALACIAGGMNAIYQIERLPLMAAILAHGVVLYVSYLGVHLLNRWLEWGIAPVLIFTGIFILGYLLIWTVVYSVTKKNTAKINELLKQKQRAAGEE